MHIPRQPQQILIPLHRLPPKPALQQMSHPPMLFVVVHRVGGHQALHEPADIGLRGFDDQMDMITHQAVKIQTDTVLLNLLAELCQELLSITVTTEDNLSTITADGDVVNRSR